MNRKSIYATAGLAAVIIAGVVALIREATRPWDWEWDEAFEDTGDGSRKDFGE